MNKDIIEKQIADRMQHLWNSQINPLVEQLNGELSKMRIARENAEKIKEEIAKTHKSLIETANQLAEAYSSVPNQPVVETSPAKK